MAQEIHNHGDIEKQVNIQKNKGNIILSNKTRFAKRFEKLNAEVANQEKYEGVMESFKYYLTKLDGVDLTTKLQDGGFNEPEIFKASIRKQNYAKKQRINRFYESAQWIDTQLFAKIKMDFEAYVEIPLIQNGVSKEIIFQTVVEKVIYPTLELINQEGENDEVLNYNVEDIFGMVYYLTGKCHINWANYDNV
ncbi:MAG: hypothetical protein HN778_04815 [Prolixibacteraceae bacterium]|jgi:hypothetical protein|nr:hypothetical protein [Prolixibacteraceae bacterium]MBT6765962.1 hypothetical protein [Prolixibacteraceae bacterium]MBT7000900.1 hypothetical protein [Prolixibacteraceae bacterium]MBT7394138.1 hypothetical protein [Prolixibacteraceae bacterium]